MIKIADGTEFKDMKEACEKLGMSSNQFRKLMKKGVIIRVEQNCSKSNESPKHEGRKRE